MALIGIKKCCKGVQQVLSINTVDWSISGSTIIVTAL